MDGDGDGDGNGDGDRIVLVGSAVGVVVWY